jgi:hypothetical protein
MCDHISKVLEWGFTDTQDFKATKYGCVNCDETSPVPFLVNDVFVDHTKCGGPDVCFGCKAAGLQLSTGDAHSAKGMSNKKWEGELNAYREARAQGIQPEGTSMAKIQEARRASDVMGKAFDANTMGDSKIIQNKTVSTLKEVGVI